MIDVEIARQYDGLPESDDRWERAVREVLSAEGIRQARISLAIVDDPTMHAMNRRYLDHDYATDVLSFLLERDADWLEGEVVVSGDTAARVARDMGWPAADELLLYIVHGTLHLVGYDDQEAECRREMRRKETEYLGRFGLRPRYSEGPPEADVR